jgi:hypothetical protein
VEQIRPPSSRHGRTSDWSNTVTVIARPREVRVVEEVLREFDSTNSPPNPEEGANRPGYGHP